MLGCGVVGTATAEILIHQRAELLARTGLDLELRSIVVRDTAKARSGVIPPSLLTTDPRRALDDPATSIVVELIGGDGVARDWIGQALAAGKDVVTANKALLALHGRELFAHARSQGRCIAFEAAVGGGIPLIESIRRGLIGNDIDAVYGILNGTCNYILTRMDESKVAYADALAEAQRLGYAESDPTLDIDGIDSAHKLTILASIAMRRACEFRDISHRGIRDIELTDLVAGEKLGFVCKLLAIARRHDDGLDLRVQPTFIPASHPLASVRGPFNAVSVYGSNAGHVLLYGRGAGGAPTASAVVADIVDVALGTAAGVFNSLAVLSDRTQAAICRPQGAGVSAFYLRVGLLDQPGGMAAIAGALGDAGVSIASLVQHQRHEKLAQGAVPVVVVTHPAREDRVGAAMKAMQKLDVVVGRVVCIPILNGDDGFHGD